MAALREGGNYFRKGLVAIVLLYVLYYLGFVNDLFLVTPLRVRHIIKLVFILLVYGAGILALRKEPAGWIIKVWHWVYGLTLLFLVLLGSYDWWLARTPEAVRSVAGDLQELLVSPVLYIGLGILRRGLAR